MRVKEKEASSSLADPASILGTADGTTRVNSGARVTDAPVPPALSFRNHLSSAGKPRTTASEKSTSSGFASSQPADSSSSSAEANTMSTKRVAVPSSDTPMKLPKRLHHTGSSETSGGHNEHEGEQNASYDTLRQGAYVLTSDQTLIAPMNTPHTVSAKTGGIMQLAGASSESTETTLPATSAVLEGTTANTGIRRTDSPTGSQSIFPPVASEPTVSTPSLSTSGAYTLPPGSADNREDRKQISSISSATSRTVSQESPCMVRNVPFSSHALPFPNMNTSSQEQSSSSSQITFTPSMFNSTVTITQRSIAATSNRANVTTPQRQTLSDETLDSVQGALDTSHPSQTSELASNGAIGDDRSQGTNPGAVFLVSDVIARFGTLLQNDAGNTNNGRVGTGTLSTATSSNVSGVISSKDVPKDRPTNMSSGSDNPAHTGSGEVSRTVPLPTTSYGHMSAPIVRDSATPVSSNSISNVTVVSSDLVRSDLDQSLPIPTSAIDADPSLSPVPVDNVKAIQPAGARARSDTQLISDQGSSVFDPLSRASTVDKSFPGGTSTTDASVSTAVSNTTLGGMSSGEKETYSDDRPETKSTTQPLVTQLATAIEGLHNEFKSSLTDRQDYGTKDTTLTAIRQEKEDAVIPTGEQPQPSSYSMTTLSMTIQTADMSPIHLNLEGQNGLATRIILQGGDDTTSHNLNSTKHDLMAALTSAGIDTSAIRIDVASPASASSGTQTHDHHSHDSINTMSQGQNFSGGGNSSNSRYEQPASKFRTSETDTISDTYSVSQGSDQASFANGRVNITA